MIIVQLKTVLFVQERDIVFDKIEMCAANNAWWGQLAKKIFSTYSIMINQCPLLLQNERYGNFQIMLNRPTKHNIKILVFNEKHVSQVATVPQGDGPWMLSEEWLWILQEER